MLEFGWPNNLAPLLDRLCSICKQIENWLCENLQNIAIIHCKGWCSRAAIVVTAYMNYTTICTWFKFKKKLIKFIIYLNNI